MSERKLYLAGIGGNRYETTLEELKKQAFEGKIKRKDKIIVSEVVDGQAKEYVVLCEKVKGLEKYFIQGEAERAVEKRRIEEEKEAARIAREKEKEEAKARKQEEKINAQKERAERERVFNNTNASEKNRTTTYTRQTCNFVLNSNNASEKKASKDGGAIFSTKADEALVAAQNSFKEANKRVSFVTNVVAILNVILLLGFLCIGGIAGETDPDLGIVVFLFALGVLFLFLVNRIIAAVLELPLQIAVFQVDAIKSIIIEVNDTVRNLEITKMSATSTREITEQDGSASLDLNPKTVLVPPREK